MSSYKPLLITIFYTPLERAFKTEQNVLFEIRISLIFHAHLIEIKFSDTQLTYVFFILLKGQKCWLFSLKPGFEDEDRLWEKIVFYKLIEFEILYRLIYLFFNLRKISWLGNAKYWKALKPIFAKKKIILIMKNLYRQTESRSIIHHVAGLSYYLYHHLNQTRTL